MAVTDYPEPSRSTNWLEGKKGSRIIGFVVIPLLLIAVVLLPPISLGKRLTGLGSERISTAGGTLTDPDGAQVTFLPGTVKQPFGASLSSLSRVSFLEGSAGKELLAAAKAIPPNLVAKSPFYQLKTNGDAAAETVMVMPIPNDSEPYETLDVYTWDTAKQNWLWLPHRVIPEDDQIESHVNAVPGSALIVQTNPKPPVFGADVPQANALPAEGKGALGQVHPTGLYLGPNGALDGAMDANWDRLANTYEIIPLIRNYEGPVVRSDLLANMLVDNKQRDAHINALVNLAVANVYKGIDIDYRGLDENLRGEFNQFIAALAAKLQEKNKTLSVRVEPAKQVAEDRWDTGAYDWQTLGLLADTVKVPAPVDPRAFVPDGQLDALLKYATGQINRYKLQPILSGQSVEQSGNYLLQKKYSDALQPLLGRIKTDLTVVEPGKPLNLALASSRPNSGLIYDPNIGTYVYRYQDDQNAARTVWLENAASLSHKLDLLKQYNIQGVTVENLPADGLDADLWRLMRDYQQGRSSPIDSNFAVQWTVKGSDGKQVSQMRPLTDPGVALAAPIAAGDVQIEAAIVDRGRVVHKESASGVTVATYAPTPTPTPVFTPTPVASPTPDFAQMTITNGPVNVRSGPSTGYGKIGDAQDGATYRITGKNEAGDWYQFSFGEDQPGWVSARFATVTGPTEALAIVKPAPAPVAAAAAPAASQPAAAPAAPAPSGGGSFAYGMQVDPNGGHMNQIPPLGIQWVKFQVPWKEFEGSKGSKGFPDGWVNEAKANGLNVMASIVKSPAWARNPSYGLRGEGPPQNPADYADYVGAFAAHFCGKVQAIEVWNEQNMDYEWGYEPLDPARYMELLKLAYASIKANCPGMIVVSGAPTPAGMVLPNAYDDREYLRGMYRNGLAGYADAIGVHPSGFGNSPDVTVQDFQAGRYSAPSHVNHASFYMLNTLQDYRSIMQSNGDSNKRLWPTEFGWGSTPSPHPGYEYEARISESTQADYIVRAYQKMKSLGYVGVAFLWCLDYNVTQPSTELAAFGILNRPAYNALRSMPK